AARWLIAGEVPEQAGNDHPTSIPTGVFRTRDGYINIASAGDEIYRRLCRALDAPTLADRPDYATGRARSQNRKTLNAEIEKITSQRDSAEWIERLNAAGVPSGPIYSIDQVFADPQVRHLGIVESVERKDGKTLPIVGQPLSLSRTPSRVAAPPPERGEHTEQVLREFGFSSGEIATL